MLEIGIPILIVIIYYVYYILTKPYEPIKKTFFINYTKNGKIPGMIQPRSRKRKRYNR